MAFSRDLLAFLVDLEQNNDKKWFVANRARYEQSLVEPAREFIRDMAPHLRGISKHIVANDAKSGGSMMRIFRDVRFSKDKRPYNTHVSMVFHHAAGKKVSAPGFYLRITSQGVHLGAGLWQPDTATANRIREHIVAKPRQWTTARDDADFGKMWRGLDGEALKRPPRGFDADHPLIEDLKRKDFVSFTELKASALTRKDFPERVAAHYRAANRLVKYICQGLDLPY